MHFKMLTNQKAWTFLWTCCTEQMKMVHFHRVIFSYKQQHLSYQSGSAFTSLLYGILWWQNVMRDGPKLNVWQSLLPNYRLSCLWFVEKTGNMMVCMVILKILWYFSFRNCNNILFQRDGAPPHWSPYLSPTDFFM
jgi:hypothetical protein